MQAMRAPTCNASPTCPQLDLQVNVTVTWVPYYAGVNHSQPTVTVTNAADNANEILKASVLNRKGGGNQ